MYLYSGMADLARLTNDPELIEACERLYENTVSRQMYVTGGVGSACLGERFTVDFDLPSDSAYAESCASIGLMLFSSRMWLLNRNKSYYDIWEQVLHNNVLSGMGRDGQHFFYVNPLGGCSSDRIEQSHAFPCKNAETKMVRRCMLSAQPGTNSYFDVRIYLRFG